MNRAQSNTIAGFAVLNALWISLTVQDTALLTIAVPQAIAAFAPRYHVTALAFLVSVSSLVAMLVPPVAGAFSDAARRNGGFRRTWIIAAVAVDALALIVLSSVRSIVGFDLLFMLAVGAENVALAAYQALIPEVVPRAQWGIASGMRGAASLIGTVVGLGVAGTIANVGIVFIATAAILVLGALTLFAFPERGEFTPIRATVIRWHDFIVVFVARGFVFFGLALLMTFVLYFFRDILHVSNPGSGTASIGMFSLLGAIASSIGLGALSDRVPRKVLVAACGIPMCVASVGFAIAPNPNVIFACAALFGIGLGGVLSVGWALAIDSLPQLTDVARDLGIWGIAANLPNVIAPIAGGWVLYALGGSRLGYQVIFALAGVSFALGSLVVLRVGAAPSRPSWQKLVWLAAALWTYAFVHVVNRVRGWGRMARNRGSTLVILNHQTPIEGMVIVSRLSMQSSLLHPIFSSTGRRMWEPGFFADRFPWMRNLWRRTILGPLFSVLGFMPIENELTTRPIASFGWDVQRTHGPLPLKTVFSSEVASRFPPGTRTSDLWSAANFDTGRTYIRYKDLAEPYRDEVVTLTREGVNRDVSSIEDVLKRGETFLLTPEGRYTPTGALLKMRALLWRLVPLAHTIYLAGMSYDLFRGRRFSLLYQLVPLRDRDAIVDELAMARPVTVTQLLAEWLVANDRPFNLDDAVAHIERALPLVPERLFVDPEVRRDPVRVTHEAIATMVRRGFLKRGDDNRLRIARRVDAHFPLVTDVFAYHARFYAESVRAATR